MELEGLMKIHLREDMKGSSGGFHARTKKGGRSPNHYRDEREEGNNH